MPVDKWRAAILARWNGRNDENVWFGIARERTQEFSKYIFKGTVYFLTLQICD